MEDILVVRAGMLLTGLDETPQPQVQVVIAAERIVEISRWQDIVLPAGGRLLEYSHGILTPCYVDSHVHLTMSGTLALDARERQLGCGFAECSQLIEPHLQDHLAHGVLLVRDGGDRHGKVAAFCSGLSGAQVGPVTVVAAGKAYHRQNRYGALIGLGIPAGVSLVEAYLAEPPPGGVVKVVNSGLNSLSEYGRRTSPQFSAAELRELVQRAAGDGRRVMVHANGEVPVEEAVRAGCQSIEHGFFMGEENLRRLADSGTVWVPTLQTMAAYGSWLARTGDRRRAAIALKNLRAQLGQLRLARKLGAMVAVGTDAGSPGVNHGEAYVEELRLFQRAGYGLGEVIMAATTSGERALGVPASGGLRVGDKARFLLHNGPLRELSRRLCRPRMLCLDGRVIHLPGGEVPGGQDQAAEERG